MAWQECVRAITEAAGRALTNDEIEAIASAVHVRMMRKMEAGAGRRAATAVAGEEVAGELTLRAILKRRDAYNNMLVWADLTNRIVDGEEAQTERGILAGRVDGTGRNAGVGIDQTHHAIRAQILGPMTEALQSANLLRALRQNDRAFNLDVARELYRRKAPESAPATGNVQATRAAEILGQAMDIGRAMQNKAGAWIGELENYMGRQYHDMFKVRGAGGDAGFQAWRNAIAPLLDVERTYPDLTPEEAESSLRATWQALANGEFDASGGTALRGFQGPGNLGKKVSQERSLIFRGPDEWFRYNEQFGKGSVMDAVVAGADRAARGTALMQTLGTNPEAMFNRLHQHLIDRAVRRDDHAMVDRLKGEFNHKVFDTVSGRASIPANATLSYIGATVREVMQLAKLGGVVISALPDLPVTAGTLRYNGINFWVGLGNQIRAILPQSAETKQIANALGAGIDGMMNAIVHRFRAEDGVPGMMARAVNTYHKLTGLTYWTEAQKTGMGLALSHNLAAHAGDAFEALPKRFQGTLRRYGIEAGEWDAARATAQAAADGRNYLLPAHIADEAVAQKFQTYIIDQVREGLNEPSALARTISTMGTRPGTVEGEIMRAMMQFKSFTLTFMQRHMGRTFYRDGVDLPGALYLMVGMGLAGYAGVVLKGLANNETPPDPQDGEGWAKLVTASLVQGGSMGMLGDVLMRNNVAANDVVGSLAGPAAGDVAQAVAALNAVRVGEKTKSRSEVAAQQGLKLALANTPNLFYLSAVYQYLFPYMLTEMVNPGTIRRRERLLRQNGQDFVLRP